MFLKRSKIILFVGFTNSRYIAELVKHPELSEYTFWCAHERPLKKNSATKYLPLFNKTFNLKNDSERADLFRNRKVIKAVTCTQERDIATYIDTLTLLKKISPTDSLLYKAAIDKKNFKETLQVKLPELVPKTYTAEEALSNSEMYPLVAKPTRLSGSSFVQILHSIPEVKKYIADFSKIQNKSILEYSDPTDFSFESFHEGRLLSVNAFIGSDQTVTTCPIMTVIPAFQINGNDTYSAIQHNLPIDDLDETALKDEIKKIVSTFNLKSTSAHFDVIQTKTGFKFIEMGLRIGGLRQEFFKEATGTDHLLNDIRNRLNLRTHPYPTGKYTALIQKAATERGVLNKISYTRSSTDPDTNTLLTELSIKKSGVTVDQVNNGGATLIKALISSKKPEATLLTAQTLFNSITFDLTK